MQFVELYWALSRQLLANKAIVVKCKYTFIFLELETGYITISFHFFQDTALHLACRGNHLQVVNILLKKSVSVTVRNLSEQTPLDVAIESRCSDAAAAIVNSEK